MTTKRYWQYPNRTSDEMNRRSPDEVWIHATWGTPDGGKVKQWWPGFTVTDQAPIAETTNGKLTWLNPCTAKCGWTASDFENAPQVESL